MENNEKELLKTIQKELKNLDKCVELCDSDDAIEYLKEIQKNLRRQEIKLVKNITITNQINNEVLKWKILVMKSK